MLGNENLRRLMGLQATDPTTAPTAQPDSLPPAAAPAPHGARIVHTVPSAARRPPCPFDLHVYATAACALALPPPPPPSPLHPPLQPALDVPGVPGARLLPSALSPSECASLIALLEGIGYAQDAVAGIDCVHLLADKGALLETLL